MVSRSLAKRYVGAVFATALEQRLEAQVGAQLLAVQRAIAGSPEFARFLKHPRVSPAEKQQMIGAALGEPLSPLLQEFILQLLRHGRIAVLAAAGTVFQILADEMASVSRAQVTTAVPLSAEQSVRLAAALTKLVGRPVVIDPSVDPDVLGGVVVKIGDDVVDGTLRTRLIEMATALAGP